MDGTVIRQRSSSLSTPRTARSADSRRSGRREHLLSASVVHAEDGRVPRKTLEPPRDAARLERKVVLFARRRRRIDAGPEAAFRELAHESPAALVAPERRLGRAYVGECAVAPREVIPCRRTAFGRVVVDECHDVSRLRRQRLRKERLYEDGRKARGDEVATLARAEDVGDDSVAAP